ncbi:hypothetical protein A2Z23_00755 [Candidatus Curtissbacteria bacterium RBG_16_39_7]|uniref:Phosphatidic acid phosphatase type 2/haloperoxidase domain-containing protein n=1 Tax=Candidatus Curtissbacteria bacterium RBG_16_39_7 TaxID=1797707 RepID=A0A1F5G1S6_9BACT|nr:MAG: hypothetical protein A2Z23_00755 [Candidatus Curtissbacteria bacterium RBG_16_39_7]
MLNEKIFYLLNNFAGKNPIFDVFFIFGARFLIILFFVFCILFLFKISKKAFLTLIFSLVLATLANQLFRFFLPIDRPFVGREVNLLFFPPQDPSFPSNHATLAASVAFLMFFYQKRVGFLAVLIAILIGLARIFVGVHWPTDVLAGLVLGFLVAFAAKKILDYVGLTEDSI